MELDYRATGKAATDQAINLAGSDWTEEQMQEAIGRAAVAAMIPETDQWGQCSLECPFFYFDNVDFELSLRSCSLSWSKWEEPGPSCPASKGGGDEA